MKKTYALFVLALLVAAALLCLVHVRTNFPLDESYERIQGSLFTGFLTIGGFLLSLKTFLLLRLKQDIYDHKAYPQKLEELQALEPKLKRYDPLARLSRLLIFTVFCSLLSAVAHLTVGFIYKPYGTIAALSLSFATLSLVVMCWNVLAKNIRIWTDFLEKHPN